ncbi:MAG: NAD(P)H-hydrate epimerase [Candidatus Hydrogenedentes bacterium]|nr:NAD(P)H-hydrate epimerase [Candidatus Hydrogenedentota bacterium]
MKTLSVAQMREADRRCIKEIGIPGCVLMNNAGTAVFRHIHSGPVGVVCGKGNNGGDGFVVARLSLLAGYETRVVLAANPESIQGDAAVFMNAFVQLGGIILAAETSKEVSSAVHSLNGCAVLVDALLGTGTHGIVRGLIRTAIETWPAIHTISVDVPSGLNADSGEACGIAIRADKTVTFGFAKNGFSTAIAKPFLGNLEIADIGIPNCCGDDTLWGKYKNI